MTRSFCGHQPVVLANRRRSPGRQSTSPRGLPTSLPAIPFVSMAVLQSDKNRKLHHYRGLVGACGSVREFRPYCTPRLLFSGCASVLKITALKSSVDSGANSGYRYFIVSAKKRSEEHTSELQSLRHLVC